MKKILAFILAAAMVLALAACGGGGNNSGGGSNAGGNSQNTPADNQGGNQDQSSGAGGAATGETISLTLWGAEEDQALLADLVEKFKATYSDYTFDIRIGVESESTAKDTILTDVEAAADVYAFASDQLPDLIAAGAIQALDSNMDAAIQNFTGKSLEDIKAANSAGSVAAATSSGTLYAFPFSADGYFMFYDPDYVTAEQAQSWDTLLEAAGAAGKKVGMTLSSGWYNVGFFYGAGFHTVLNEDGTTDIDWAGTSSQGITGVQVVQSMLNIAGNSAFLAIADGDISNQIASGTLCAAVSGCWDSIKAQESFGDDYVACKLPTFTCNGSQVQMGSVASFKLMGVNPYAENVGWAVMLAEFLSNEESQVARYEARDLPPTNLSAASDPAVAANKGVTGLGEQSAYAVVQTVGGKYWDPAGSFGEQIAQGTIANDEASIQAALDELVTGVTAPIG